MILNVTLSVDLDAVTDPATIIGRVTESLGTAMRDVEGVTAYQVTRVTPEDEAPPLQSPAKTTPEETP